MRGDSYSCGGNIHLLSDYEIERIADAVAKKLAPLLIEHRRQLADDEGLGIFEKPGKAAEKLGCSPSTLKRRREQGVFKLGEHYVARRDQGGKDCYLYCVATCRFAVASRP